MKNDMELRHEGFKVLFFGIDDVNMASSIALIIGAIRLYSLAQGPL